MMVQAIIVNLVIIVGIFLNFIFNITFLVIPAIMLMLKINVKHVTPMIIEPLIQIIILVLVI